MLSGKPLWFLRGAGDGADHIAMAADQVLRLI